tara:strand:+ start:76 stop:261 length:186 start_codon:yes stop_codon:yes gene_type:complete
MELRRGANTINKISTWKKYRPQTTCIVGYKLTKNLAQVSIDTKNNIVVTIQKIPAVVFVDL